MKNEKQQPATGKKQEIKVKNSSAADALKRAPDEVIARAIHDVLLKQKDGKQAYDHEAWLSSILDTG